MEAAASELSPKALCQASFPRAASHRRVRGRQFEKSDLTKIAVSGKVCRTLSLLIAAGARGITAQSCGRWACRLAAYIYVLRHRYGLEIVTHRIQSQSSWEARYVLLSAVHQTGGVQRGKLRLP
jgi:hypothetical protein